MDNRRKKEDIKKKRANAVLNKRDGRMTHIKSERRGKRENRDDIHRKRKPINKGNLMSESAIRFTLRVTLKILSKLHEPLARKLKEFVKYHE